MGSNLMESRDFIKFIWVAGKWARKRSNKTLTEAETATSYLWWRRNWALCAPEPMQNLRHLQNTCPKSLWPPLQVKLASIRVWKYIYRTGYSSIFLLITLNISVVQQRESVSKLCPNTQLLPRWCISCCSKLGSALWSRCNFPCHQN